MTNLPVREMVLYKHGVGFFVRGGDFTGDTVSLTFRADEINDVLKSLAVFDQAEGGQVLGVHYQTPMDKEHRLASSSIKLSSRASLTDLIRDLRGRHVVMNFETLPGRIDSVTGRVIGINIQQQPDNAADTIDVTTITLLSTEGEVYVYPLATLRTFTIEDTQSEHDLRYFLDTSMSEDDRRVVHVRLNDMPHDLVVSYVAPSPTWRVSYRVVAESKDDGSTGTALLQGWGLFDNRLEEDLDGVRVTLVAGQPISFIYDLYESRIPQRPTIKEEARVTGPVEFARGVARDESFDDDADFFAAAAEAAPAAPMMAGAMMRSAAPRRMRKEAAAASTPPAAEGRETGETFQYVVTAPVSVKRGESALVPIIGAEVAYERELLYNRDKLADHPVAALRFTNTTGLTLERGPVTIVEDDDYKGEAILAFTKADNAVYLPYAVELGINVNEESRVSYEHHAIDIKDGVLIEQQYQVTSHRYKIENTTDKPRTVTLERAISDSADLHDTPPPDAETLTEKRWRVDVPAHTTEAFTVRIRQMLRHRHELRSITFKQVQYWAEKRYLDQETFEELSELLKTLQFIEKTRQQINKLNDEKAAIYKNQTQLRADLEALGHTGREGELRARVLGGMEKAHDRLEAIEREIAAGERTITEAEKKVEGIINAFGRSM